MDTLMDIVMVPTSFGPCVWLCLTAVSECGNLEL